MEESIDKEHSIIKERGVEKEYDIEKEHGIEKEPDLTGDQEEFSLSQAIRQTFSIEEKDIHLYSPLVLAFIGDGIYDLIIRTILVEKGNQAVEKLHKRKSNLVKAESQSKMAEAIQEYLTEAEQDIYRRGRNAKSYTMAKNARMSDYRRATGLEALCGYLYLTGDMPRLLHLLRIGIELISREDDKKC